MAAAIGPGDSPDQHFADTITAGRGLCDPAAVRVLVTEGIDRIGDLERLGVEFDRTRDGRTTWVARAVTAVNRILHAGGSATGAAIAERLIALRPGRTADPSARARRGHWPDLRRAAAAAEPGCCIATS